MPSSPKPFSRRPRRGSRRWRRATHPRDLRKVNRPDSDSPDPMNGFAGLFAGDQLVSPHGKGRCDVEGVEGGKAGIGSDVKRFLEEGRLKRRPNVDALKKRLVKCAFVCPLVESRFGENLEPNEEAGRKRPFRIVQNGKRHWGAREASPSRRNQHARINEGNLQKSRSLTPPRRSTISRSRSSQSSRGSPEATIRFRSSQSRRPRGVLGLNSSPGTRGGAVSGSLFALLAMTTKSYLQMTPLSMSSASARPLLSHHRPSAEQKMPVSSRHAPFLWKTSIMPS